MSWTPERWAALAYGLAALAAGSIVFILLFFANPPNVSAGDMLRTALFESAHRGFYWYLVVLPLLCVLLAAAYLTPFATRKRMAVALWIAGVALAVATWFTALVPVAFLATVATVLITAFTPVPAGGTRLPTCPRCAAEITRRQIAMATFPHWLMCRSCKAPLIGDRFVKREATALGTILVIWLLSTLGTMYLVGSEIAEPLLLLGAILYLVLWPSTVILTCQYGSYVEREPTASRWWALDVWQWVRPHR